MKKSFLSRTMAAAVTVPFALSQTVLFASFAAGETEVQTSVIDTFNVETFTNVPVKNTVSEIKEIEPFHIYEQDSIWNERVYAALNTMKGNSYDLEVAPLVEQIKRIEGKWYTDIFENATSAVAEVKSNSVVITVDFTFPETKQNEIKDKVVNRIVSADSHIDRQVAEDSITVDTLKNANAQAIITIRTDEINSGKKVSFSVVGKTDQGDVNSIQDAYDYADSKINTFRDELVSGAKKVVAIYQQELDTATAKFKSLEAAGLDTTAAQEEVNAAQQKLDDANYLVETAVDKQINRYRSKLDKAKKKADNALLKNTTQTYTGANYDEVLRTARAQADAKAKDGTAAQKIVNRIPDSLDAVLNNNTAVNVYAEVIRQLTKIANAESYAIDMPLETLVSTAKDFYDVEVNATIANGDASGDTTAYLADNLTDADIDYYYSYFNDLLAAQNKEVDTLTTYKMLEASGSETYSSLSGDGTLNIKRVIEITTKDKEETTTSSTTATSTESTTSASETTSTESTTSGSETTNTESTTSGTGTETTNTESTTSGTGTETTNTESTTSGTGTETTNTESTTSGTGTETTNTESTTSGTGTETTNTESTTSGTGTETTNTESTTSGTGTETTNTESTTSGTGTETTNTESTTSGTGTETTSSGSETTGTETTSSGSETTGTETTSSGSETTGTETTSSGSETTGTETTSSGSETTGTETTSSGSETTGTETTASGSETTGTETTSSGSETTGTETTSSGSETTGTETTASGTETTATETTETTETTHREIVAPIYFEVDGNVEGNKNFYFSHDPRPFDIHDLAKTAKVKKSSVITGEDTYVDVAIDDLASENFDVSKISFGLTDQHPDEGLSPKQIFEALPEDAAYALKPIYIYYDGQLTSNDTGVGVAYVYIGVKGDINFDRAVNARDAATLLVYSTAIGANQPDTVLYRSDDPNMEAFAWFLGDINSESPDMGQTTNNDNIEEPRLNAPDSSYIRIYATKYGLGQTPDWGSEVIVVEKNIPKISAAITKWIADHPEEQDQ